MTSIVKGGYYTTEFQGECPFCKVMINPTMSTDGGRKIREHIGLCDAKITCPKCGRWYAMTSRCPKCNPIDSYKLIAVPSGTGGFRYY